MSSQLPGFTYIGCYNDVPSRTLPNQHQNISNSAIQNAHAGKMSQALIECWKQTDSNDTVIGLQDGGQCFSGTGQQYSKYGSGKCPGGTHSPTKNPLGGAWYQQIYALAEGFHTNKSQKQIEEQPLQKKQIEPMSSSTGVAEAISTTTETATLQKKMDKMKDNLNACYEKNGVLLKSNMNLQQEVIDICNNYVSLQNSYQSLNNQLIQANMAQSSLHADNALLSSEVQNEAGIVSQISNSINTCFLTGTCSESFNTSYYYDKTEGMATPQTSTYTTSLASGVINDYQNNIQNLQGILNNENTRLQQKQQTVNNAIQTQERVIQFNESYNKKYGEYVYMVKVVVIGLILIFCSNLLHSFVPFFPSAFFTVLIVFIVSIIIGMTWWNMSLRSNMDFTQYNLNPPAIQSSATATTATNTASELAGNLLGGFNGCVGSNCCSTGTEWDSGNAVCIPMPTI